MPRPRFITCTLCGRGFGSASISIHVPQCYEKALKRWRLDPSGPRPVMPAPHGAAKKGPMGGAGGPDEQPCGGGISAVRSFHASNGLTAEAPSANPNLHPCSKCGRHFSYDRVGYHESVCKGDRKRRVFDSSKQRRASGEEGGASSFSSGAAGGRGKKRGLGTPSTTSRYTPAPAPRTNWRQQHAEFIMAIRGAKRADGAAQSMWGDNSNVASGQSPNAFRGNAARAPAPRAPARRISGDGGVMNARLTNRAMPPPSGRVPPLMTMQSDTLKTNTATGGRAAQAKAMASPSRPARGGRVSEPPQRRPQPGQSNFGGTGVPGDRFSGRSYSYGAGGGGGGGAVRILNDNTTSVGMLQALGQA